MISDADLNKLKSVFATNNDLSGMESRIKKEIVNDIVQYLQDHILPLLNEHEKRIDRLEKTRGWIPFDYLTNHVLLL